jgi:hypothetical protein
VILIRSWFRRWARLSNGYWVALANGKYVSWTGSFIEDRKNALSPETQLEVILRTSELGPGVNSSRPEVLPRLAISAAPNREGNDGTVISGRVEVDGLKYRRRPNIESDAIGQYPIRTKISITGFTEEGTTVIKGDA